MDAGNSWFDRAERPVRAEVLFTKRHACLWQVLLRLETIGMAIPVLFE
jgi:hypothetical protein